MVNVKCGRCGYKWDTKSEMWYVGCPRCGRKVLTPIGKEELKRQKER